LVAVVGLLTLELGEIDLAAATSCKMVNRNVSSSFPNW